MAPKPGTRPWNAGQRVEVRCAHCGKAMLRIPFEVTRSKALYCDRACKDAAYRASCAGEGNPHYGDRAGEERPCETCGKVFYSYPSQPKRYCSAACYTPALRAAAHAGKVVTEQQKAKQRAAMRGRRHPERVKPPIVITCPQCGTTVEYAGRKRYFAQFRKFCSTDCWYAYARLHPEAHGAFRGGVEPYYGPDWRRQQKLARERDNHTCQVCGVRQVNPRLDVHHIKSRRSFGRDDYERMNALPNLITLCKACHTRAEKTIARTMR